MLGLHQIIHRRLPGKIFEGSNSNPDPRDVRHHGLRQADTVAAAAGGISSCLRSEQGNIHVDRTGIGCRRIAKDGAGPLFRGFAPPGRPATPVKPGGEVCGPVRQDPDVPIRDKVGAIDVVRDAHTKRRAAPVPFALHTHIHGQLAAELQPGHAAKGLRHLFHTTGARMAAGIQLVSGNPRGGGQGLLSG